MNETHSHPDMHAPPPVEFATVHMQKLPNGLTFSGCVHDWVSTLHPSDTALLLHDAGDALHLLAKTFEDEAGKEGAKGLHLVETDDGGDDDSAA